MQAARGVFVDDEQTAFICRYATDRLRRRVRGPLLAVSGQVVRLRAGRRSLVVTHACKLRTG
jgi:hypothetical protein